MKRKLILAAILFCVFAGCSKHQQVSEQKVFVEKVPPIYDDKLSDEENYYRFRHFLFPREEIPNPIPEGLPYDHSLLFITVEKNENLKLNSEDAGKVSDPKPLTDRLRYIFQEREENRVYETGTSKVVKAVGIKTADSIKYGDFIKVVDAVKQSGADPVVLLFDSDGLPKLKVDISKDRENER